MVRLCVEDPGVRFDGNVVLHPVLAASAAGKSAAGNKTEMTMDFMVLSVLEPRIWARVGKCSLCYIYSPRALMSRKNLRELVRSPAIRGVWNMVFGQCGIEHARITPSEMKRTLNRSVAVPRGNEHGCG